MVQAVHRVAGVVFCQLKNYFTSHFLKCSVVVDLGLIIVF